MLSLVLLATLAADPTVSLAVPGFQLIDLDAEHGPFLESAFAQQLQRQGLQVTTSTQLRLLVGLERQKQLVGCSEDNSCLIELANALGTDGLVLGSLAKLSDGSVQINVRIVSATTARLMTQWSARLGSEEALLRAFSTEAPRLAADVREVMHPSSGPSRAWALAPAAVAVGLGVAAAFMLGTAESNVQKLNTGPLLDGDVQVFAQQTRGLQIAGAALGIGAGVSAGLAIALLALLGPREAPRPVAWISPSGGGLGLTWVFR